MTTPSPALALTDALLFTGEAFVENKALLLQNGHVLDIVPNDKVPDSFEKQPYPHAILAPGYIDCQVNGGGNVLLNAKPTAEAARSIAAAHLKKGTTRLLPTVITDKPEITRAAVIAAREAKRHEPTILGIHVEGPHISKDKNGAHNAAHIRTLTPDDLALYAPEPEEIFLLTLAPECVPVSQVRQITESGVIVSIGHTGASPSCTREALEAGATGFTHLFNAMEPVSSRKPGVVGVALDDKNSWASIIADSVHVAAELVRLAVRAKDKLFFVSDAMPPAGANKPEPFELLGERITVQNGACRYESGALAGASLTLGEIVPRAIRDDRLDPGRVLRMASAIPADFLGLGHRFGRLLPGYVADIVALDHSFNVQSVWQNGIKR